MWIREHPYLSFYLVGCCLVVILTGVKFVLYSAIDWVTKAHILKKNLRKLELENSTRLEKLYAFLSWLLLDVPLSWINAVFISWQIATTTFINIREAFSTTPDEVKALRFPLLNNAYLPRESVWAYATALSIKAHGALPNEDSLLWAIHLLPEKFPQFDSIAALRQLESLKVLDPAIIAAVVSRLSKPPAVTEIAE